MERYNIFLSTTVSYPWVWDAEHQNGKVSDVYSLETLKHSANQNATGVVGYYFVHLHTKADTGLLTVLEILFTSRRRD